MRLLLYSCYINKIGGIETFIRNFCKRMKPYFDITVLYAEADKDQLKDIKKHAKTEQFTGQTVETDLCLFVTANWGILPEANIIADKYFQMVHADYEKTKEFQGFVYEKANRVTEHVAVGKVSRDSFVKMYGYRCDVIYNLLDKDNEEKYRIENKHKFDGTLRLITASRYGAEKGFDRILTMAEKFKKRGIPFIWDIYTDLTDTNAINKYKHIPQIVFHKPTLDILDHVFEADYLVQLSDTEAFCYSIYEALQIHTPCIITNFKSSYEQVEDGKTGYILNMNLDNLDVDKIYNNIPRYEEFKEFSSEQDWLNFLKYNPEEKVKVINTAIYTDKERGRDMYPNEPYRWEKLPRALALVRAGYCKIVLGNEDKIKKAEEIDTNNPLYKILDLLNK